MFGFKKANKLVILQPFNIRSLKTIPDQPRHVSVITNIGSFRAKTNLHVYFGRSFVAKYIYKTFLVYIEVTYKINTQSYNAKVLGDGNKLILYCIGYVHCIY